MTDQRDEVDDVFAMLARAGVDFVRCDRGERLPKPEQGLRLGLVNVKRFDRQAAGQLFDLAVTHSGGIRAAVKDADGFDFVFVVGDELTETGDQRFGSLPGFGIKTGGQQLVSREFVDDLMLGPQQDFAELRVVKRQQGGADLFGFDFVQLGVGDCVGRDAEVAGSQLAVFVGVDAVEERGDELAGGLAVGLLFEVFVPRFAATACQPGELGSECAGEVGVDDAFADFFEDALERDGGLAIKRLGLVLVLFAQSDGVDDDEAGFAGGVGRDGFEASWRR